MAIIVESEKGFHIATAARLVESDKEVAWAEDFISPNPAYGYVLGKYVEADNANSNRQYFDLGGLRLGRGSLEHAPLNINHIDRRVVGAFVKAELVYPTDAEAAADGEPVAANPYMEALSVFWRHYFPDEYRGVQMANSEGNLFYSMEAVARQLKCSGDVGCQQTFDYAGVRSPTYCAHLNDPQFGAVKHLIDPHFVGGALIVPPERPGWKNANITQVAGLIEQQLADNERALKAEAEHLSAEQWEGLMFELNQLAAQK